VIVGALALALGSREAAAQPAAQGFAFERAYPSAPGAGWIVMDDLNIPDELGGALAITLGYERNPVVVSGLAVVSDALHADIGASIHYARWRYYVDIDTALAVSGASGLASAYAYTAPSLDPSGHPDAITDVRLGADVRVLGQPGDPLRIGAGAQLYAPNDNRANYTTDGTFRGVIRALVAGDHGHFTWAGQFGAHVRPLDDSPTPGSPRGNELVLGLAGGVTLCPCARWGAVIGPELYGASALRALFGSSTTAFEGLLSARLEQRGAGQRVRIRLAIGSALHHEFGAAEWRVLAGVELFGHAGS